MMGKLKAIVPKNATWPQQTTQVRPGSCQLPNRAAWKRVIWALVRHVCGRKLLPDLTIHSSV